MTNPKIDGFQLALMIENRDSDYVAGWNQARPIQKPLQLTLEQVAKKFEVESVEIVK